MDMLWQHYGQSMLLSIGQYESFAETMLTAVEREVKFYMRWRSNSEALDGQEDVSSFFEMMHTAAMIYKSEHDQLLAEFNALREIVRNQDTTPAGVANFTRLLFLRNRVSTFAEAINILMSACERFVDIVKIHGRMRTPRIVFGADELQLILGSVSMLPLFPDFHGRLDTPELATATQRMDADPNARDFADRADDIPIRGGDNTDDEIDDDDDE